MIAMLLRRLALVAILSLLWMLALERFNPAPRFPLLIDADYRQCVTIHNGPLVKKRKVGGRPAVSEII